MKITFCLFTEINDWPRTLNIYGPVISKIIKRYNNFTIINFGNLLNNKPFLNKDLINFSTNQDKFEGKLNIFNPLTKEEFFAYIKNKNIFAFDALGKSLITFKIRRLINKNNIKLILLMNVGYLSNSRIFSISNFKKSFFTLQKRIINLIYRFLVLIKYFPNIFIYFESRKEIYDSCILNKKSLLSQIFPFLNILYFQNIYKINSISYDRYIESKNNLKENKILFLDGNYKHGDILFGQNFDLIKLQKIYFERLENFFRWISLLFNQPVEICLHPSSDKREYKNFFKDRLITQNSTYESIKNASIVVFHESSAFLDAIFYKKKIISLNTFLFGAYLSNRIDYYRNQFNLVSINLDFFNSDFAREYKPNNLLEDLEKVTSNYDHYINKNLKTDTDEKSSDKVIRILESYEKNY